MAAANPEQQPLHLNTDSPLAVAGICLAIAANLIISAGLNGQKWVHNENERTAASERKPYTKQPLWWLGLFGTIMGEVLNFLAFGFAGAAIVTPLGAVCVVANEVIACVFLGEAFRMRDLFGVLLTVIGSVLVVIAAPVSDRAMTVADFLVLASGKIFLTYMTFVVVAMVVIWRLLPQVQRKHPAWGLTLCSLLGTMTVLCATAISNFLRQTVSGRPQLLHPVPWLLVLIMVPSAIGQVRYLNETMERFDNTTVVPVYYILFTLSTVTGSAMLYQDFYEQPWAAVFLFVSGCFLCFGGVGLLTTGRAEHKGEAHPQGHVQLGAVDDVEIAFAPEEEQRARASSISRGAGGAEASAGGLQPLSRRASSMLDGFHAASSRGLVSGSGLPSGNTSPKLRPSEPQPLFAARDLDLAEAEPDASPTARLREPAIELSSKKPGLAVTSSTAAGTAGLAGANGAQEWGEQSARKAQPRDLGRDLDTGDDEDALELQQPSPHSAQPGANARAHSHDGNGHGVQRDDPWG